MRKRRKYGKKGQFMQLPYAVLDSPSYIGASSSSKQLLIDIFRQFNGRNNGDLSASFTLMQKRGWKSKSTLARALEGLLKAELIITTREGWFQGKHSSRCALYAVTWLGINECNGKDLEVKPNPRPRRAFTLENKTLSCPESEPKSVQNQGRTAARDSKGRFVSTSKKGR